MKIIARILMILAAAGAVTGVTMALVGAQAEVAGAPQRGPAAQMQPSDNNAFPGNSSGEQRRGPRGSEHGGLFGAGEVLKNLVVVALIVAVAAPLTRLLRRIAARSANRPAAGPAAKD